MAKLFMIIGVIIFIIGFIMQFIPIGKLPGDFVIKKGSTTFYFPTSDFDCIKYYTVLDFLLHWKISLNRYIDRMRHHESRFI